MRVYLRAALFLVASAAIMLSISNQTVPQSSLIETSVISIVDGDGLVVPINGVSTELRITGIDAPERQYGMCYATEATQELARLVGSGPVWILLTGSQSNNREVAFVFLDSQAMADVGEELVRSGHAVTLSDRYEEAQEQARSNNLGLWGDCFNAGHDLVLISINPTASDETVTIYNRGNTVNLSGWTLYSSPWGGDFQQCSLPAQDVIPFSSFVIHSGSSAAAPTSSHSVCTTQFIWHNNGDSAWLVDPDGRFEDLIEYSGGYREF